MGSSTSHRTGAKKSKVNTLQRGKSPCWTGEFTTARRINLWDTAVEPTDGKGRPIPCESVDKQAVMVEVDESRLPRAMHTS